MVVEPFPPESAGELLDQVLAPLLNDFQQSFQRGLVLLQHCPERVLSEAGRTDLKDRLELAQAELAAARALRQAAPTPMALEMATIAPWHQLVLEVWSLSAALRAAGVALPR
jgi:hypothetical protein